MMESFLFYTFFEELNFKLCFGIILILFQVYQLRYHLLCKVENCLIL